MDKYNQERVKAFLSNPDVQEAISRKEYSKVYELADKFLIFGVARACVTNLFLSIRAPMFLNSFNYLPTQFYAQASKSEFSNMVEDWEIPSNVEYIGMDAFASSKIKSIKFSDYLKDIGHSAFSRCTLTRVDLPRDLKTIAGYAFAGTNLQEITLPFNCSIDRSAFSSLQSNAIEIVFYFPGTEREFKSNYSGSSAAFFNRINKNIKIICSDREFEYEN